MTLSIPSIWTLLSLGFLFYMGNSIYTLYKLYLPVECSGETRRCLKPALDFFPKFQMRLYLSSEGDDKLVLLKNNIDLSKDWVETINVTIPLSTRKNGTMTASAFLLTDNYPKYQQPQSAEINVPQHLLITHYMIPVEEAFALVTGKSENSNNPRMDRPIAHIYTKLQLLAVEQPLHFDAAHLPHEIGQLMLLDSKKNYLPIFYFDELALMAKYSKPIYPHTDSVNITIHYNSASIGKLRMHLTMRESLKHMYAMGFTEKDTDDVRSLFTDTNIYLLCVTMAVATVHLLLDVLAFKNDISFWRNRKDMVGLSTRTQIWHVVSHTIIAVYLYDQKTSLLVLIPTGFGALVEYWKLKKALKIRFVGWRPHIEASTKEEQHTSELDEQGMHYLAYLLVPLVIAGAIYSLFYVPHTSWESWLIESLANGVYAFGFLFMLPQLFINHKLKSVAHLPWRAFMYKAFNTFIDDLFAFIIHMPTAHRVACFRDDVIFLLYLYQRYLYPVDKSRANEFGQTFDDDQKDKKLK